MVELHLEYHPVARHQPATPGHSQQFQHLQPSVDAYKLRLLSKNHLGLECSPSGASGGRVTGVQAASAVTPVTSSRHVYILHELFFCTFSCLSSFMHCFRIARSAIAVHCDYRVARHPLRTLLLTEPEPEQIDLNGVMGMTV